MNACLLAYGPWNTYKDVKNFHLQALLGVQAVVLPGTAVGEGATLSVSSSPLPGASMQPGFIYMGSPAFPIMKAAPSSSSGEIPDTLTLRALAFLLPIIQLTASWIFTTIALLPAAAVAYAISGRKIGASAGLDLALVTSIAAVGLSVSGAAAKKVLLGKLSPASDIKKYSTQNLMRMLVWVLETRADELFGQAVRGSEWWNRSLRSRGLKIGNNVYIDTLWAGDYELVSYEDGAVVDRSATVFAHLGLYKGGEFSMSQDAVTVGEGALIAPRAAALPGYSLKSNEALGAGQVGLLMKS